MSDLPQEDRNPEEVKPVTEAQNVEHKHTVSQRTLTQEELKKIQEEQKSKGYRLQLNKTIPGNELAVIAELISAMNGNIAGLTLAVREFVEAYKDGRSTK